MQRRKFLQSLYRRPRRRHWLSPALAALPKMKITRVRAYEPPNPNPLFNQSDLVVTVETDAGITGIGEGGSKDTPGAERRPPHRRDPNTSSVCGRT